MAESLSLLEGKSERRGGFRIRRIF